MYTPHATVTHLQCLAKYILYIDGVFLMETWHLCNGTLRVPNPLVTTPSIFRIIQPTVRLVGASMYNKQRKALCGSYSTHVKNE